MLFLSPEYSDHMSANWVRIGLCIWVLQREILQFESKGSLEVEFPRPWGISTDILSFLQVIGCGSPTCLEDNLFSLKSIELNVHL